MLGSIVAVVAPVVACGLVGDEDPTEMPERAQCPVMAEGNRYAALTLGPAADGAVFYGRPTYGTTPSGDDAGAGGPGYPPGSGSLGTVCGGATDRAGCLAKVNASLGNTGGWQYARPDDQAANEKDYGIVTKGDEVRVITTVDELRAVVAPIDSLDEAAAMAMFSNRRLSCGGNNARTESDGYVLQYVGGGCGGPEVETLFKVHRDGTITEVEKNELSSGDPDCIEGRRPAGYVVARRAWLASLPAHLAEIAHMEAAAVIAFAELRDELLAHGAPPMLVARVERARRDEVAHDAIMTELAEAHGAIPPRLEQRSTSPRSLLALALDNAEEGCVRETYGALVAAHQAMHASDPALRAAFARIAADEAEHAALSLDLRDWLSAKLSPHERALVAAAEASAWSVLEGECAAVRPSFEVQRVAGMPSASVASALVRSLRRRLAA